MSSFIYYICQYSEADTLASHIKEKISEELIANFAHLCAKLHNQGVLHRDFNPLNILVEQAKSTHSLSLVDINRISWENNLSIEKAMSSMSRLSLPRKIENTFLEKYAELREYDLKQCQQILEKEKSKTERYFRNKRRLRKIFPKK